MTLPTIPSLSLIKARLPLIFNEALENRGNCVSEASARTIQVMFYAGAIERTDRWIRPSQVTHMTDAQMAKTSAAEREAWCALMLSNRKKKKPEGTWYASDSREQIRDDSLRYGLVPTDAVVEKPGVPTTSSKPRYALRKDFADLFSASLSGKTLEDAIDAWQKKHLSKTALARHHLIKQGAAASGARVTVTLPNGAAINLSSGPSSVLTKAVIEVFAKNFLHSPALLWVSESGQKEINATLAKQLGLKIDVSKSLPDVILVDLPGDGGLTVVFVEVVHSDGPVNQLRKDALEAIAVEAGFDPANLTYVTAFADRGGAPHKKLAPTLAWNTFVWCASEPECVIALRRGVDKKLDDLR